MAAQCATLVDLLRLRAREQPEQPAYIFLPDHGERSLTLTYGALDQRARSVAACLQAAGALRERVLLLLPPGLEYVIGFFGCLYAGAIAVPAYPMLSRRRRDRLEAIAADADAGFALAVASTVARLDEFTDLPGCRALRVLSYDACVGHDAREWRSPQLDGTALAFLQYTSGSTASPRGVMISHDNLMYNEGMIARAMGHSARTSLVSWLPPHHDMGLIGGLLQPFYVGSCCIFMSPTAFLRRPVRWLETIAQYQAHTSGAPDFAYRLCVERTSPEQRARLDLRHWKVAFTGSEPVREDTLDRFARAFEPCGFRRQAFFPCYGLAEATLVVSAGLAGVEPAICRGPDLPREGRAASWVSCGRALPDTGVAIVDPERLTPQNFGQVGEIWVKGPGVALGYWNGREATERTFRAYLGETGDGPFLRTGDLGFFRDGQLFITGRLKDLMIFRGINHHPQDIEWTVASSHACVRQDHTAAFSVQLDGEERLIVVTEVERTVESEQLAEIISAIREAVAAEHGIPVHGVVILQWGSLPKTSSGKVQRQICRERFLNESLETIETSILSRRSWSGPGDFPLKLETLREAADEARLSLIETSLRQFLARALDLEASQIEASQSLPALGADSLTIVDLQNSMESRLGILLPMARLLDASSVSHCARMIFDELAGASPKSSPQTSVPEQTGSEYPLSYGQQALWFLYRLMPESPAYHIAQALSIKGPLDAGALRRSLQALLDRHESLRTIFVDVRGEPAQRIQDRAELILTETEASKPSAGEVQEWLRREMLGCFDLERGPLLRASLLRQSPQQYVLLLGLHHIVADGWSLRVLVHEMSELYQALRRDEVAQLPHLSMRYVDYVQAQRKNLSGKGIEAQFAYWKSQLANASTLRLPTDHMRSAAHSFRGGGLSFVIPQALTTDLKDFSRREGVTLFMTLLAMFKVLLHDRSQQDDIVVGTDFINRKEAASRDLVGHLVNQLVLRTDLSGNPTCREVVARVRAVAIAAYARHDVPFQQLVSRLKPDRHIGKNPFFQVMFTFRNAAITPLEFAGLSVTSLQVDGVAEKFDVTMALEVTSNGLSGSVGYNRDLFEAATVSSMIRDFELLLRQAVADPGQTLTSLQAKLSSNTGSPGMQGRTTMFPTSFGSIKPRKIVVSPSSLVTREDIVPGAAKFSMIRPAQNGVDLAEWARERRDDLTSELLTQGAVLMRGFGVKSVPEFEAFAQAVSSHLFSQNGEHPRESISDHIQTPVAYPSRQKLLWHNENSFNLCWPTKLWFCCLKPAEQGGETPLVDSREVFRRIDPAIRAKFLEKRVMYVRTYGEGLGLNWRTVFGTEQPGEVEKFCASNGLQWEWKDGGRLRTSCIRPAAVRHPQTGEMTWFNQAQHWHLSCLDAEIRQSLLALCQYEDLPRNCFYGDGSVIEDKVMEEILDVYRTLEVTFPWQEGDVLMLDNLLVAHARNPFVGERKLLVAMGDMESYDSIGTKSPQSL
jgi:acyl-CoA synthetase (AMP-forming)/AMP-acid ligase II/alpha-ketoglutarate-dependent taurine dioxygenase/acyl carrier protein